MRIADLQTPTLRLVAQTRDNLLRIIETMSASEKAQLATEWLTLLDQSAAVDPWVHGFRLVHRNSGVEVGTCGFKGPPADGVVEIAYGVADDQQGKGYATEAAQALLAYAFACGTVRTVRAHTLPQSGASQRVLAKCGFRRVGEVQDPDDGLVWRFEKSMSHEKPGRLA